MYDHVQEFSFANIDKFSTASIVTRLTTDVTNVQMAFQMCIRIAARALLKKPQILILDDSTSAVDMKTDAMIRQAFSTEIPDTTKIIIAQRIASVQDADQIVVLDDGKIADVGNHQQLMKNSEIYREVYESQNKGGGLSEQ